MGRIFDDPGALLVLAAAAGVVWVLVLGVRALVRAGRNR